MTDQRQDDLGQMPDDTPSEIGEPQSPPETPERDPREEGLPDDDDAGTTHQQEGK